MYTGSAESGGVPGAVGSAFEGIPGMTDDTKQRCANCEGQGYYFYATVGDMLTCGRRDDINVTMRYMVTCPDCKGTGCVNPPLD